MVAFRSSRCMGTKYANMDTLDARAVLQAHLGESDASEEDMAEEFDVGHELDKLVASAMDDE